MKVSSLLELNKNSQNPKGLLRNLGDNYLLEHNFIYKKIRSLALKQGYSYTTEFNPDYLVLPMGQLDLILEEKKIPYLDNVTALEALNEKACGLLEWDHVVDNLKPNYVLHESCHAIARTFKLKSDDQKVKITSMLLEESFANTCEFIAIADANNVHHKIFLEMNSYFTVFEDRTHLKKAIDKYGYQSFFKFMLYNYMHSNFLNESMNEQVFNKIIEKSNFASQIEVKTLKSLARNAFVLNPRFRYNTTEMYLRMNGNKDPLKNVLDFDYFKFIEENSNLDQFISDLVSSIGTEYD